jgi:hypothetical protein
LFGFGVGDGVMEARGVEFWTVKAGGGGDGGGGGDFCDQ